MKLFKYVIIACLFFLIFLFCLKKIGDYDLWMHLKTGEFILTNLTLPHQDIYSYTAEGNFWANTHWLFQIIIFPLYKNFAAGGIIILKAVVVLLSFFVLFRIGYRKENWFFSLLFVFLIFLVARDRFVERPEFFSYLFLSIYLLVLYTFRYNRTKFVFVLPFLQILWTNIHVFSFVGIGIIFLFLLGEFISWKIKLPWAWNSPLTLKGRDFWSLFWVGVACIVASILNPYTYKIYFIPFQLFDFLRSHRELLLGGISELMPPFINSTFFGPGFFFYKLLIIVSLLSFIINFRRLNLNNFFIYVVFLHLSLSAIRNIVLFSLICMPIMVDNTVYLLDKLNALKKRCLMRFAYSGFKVLVFSWIIITAFRLTHELLNQAFYEHGKVERVFGLGVLDVYPEGAVDFILQQDIKGNIFNTFGYGGYFIWRCFPKKKVFIDGRTAIYGEDHLRYYADVMYYGGVFDDLISRFDINYFLLDINAGGILRRLYQDPKWKLVFLDSQVAIYLKEKAENREIIEKFEIDLEKYNLPKPDLGGLSTLRKKPFPSDYFRLGIFFYRLEMWDKAKEAYKYALEINPRVAQIHNNLGAIYQGEGRVEEAISEYKKAIELNKNLTNAYVNLGLIYQERGMIDEAMRLYQEAGSIFRPFNAMLHNNLGNIYREKGYFRKAIAEFNKAIQLNPRSYEFYYNKGLTFAKMGRIESALGCFRKAQELEPDVALIHNNLGACFLEKGDFTRAKIEFERALELDPDLAEAKSNLKKLEGLQ